MGHFYFVRHGQTVWNVEGKICGRTDSELTEYGHQQAVETGRKFLEEGIQADEILYSPLARAAETARHISEIMGIPAKAEPRLIEQHFGKWEGTSPRNAADFQKEKNSLPAHHGNGESTLQLAQRIYNLLDDIKAGVRRKDVHSGCAQRNRQSCTVVFYRHDERRIRDIWSEKLRNPPVRFLAFIWAGGGDSGWHCMH